MAHAKQYPSCIVEKPKFQGSLVPPQLADNAAWDGAFAKIYDWPEPWSTASVRGWIHAAFGRRDAVVPDNSRKQFVRNRSGPCANGWMD